MKNKVRHGLLAATVVVTIVFYVRQRTLNALRVGNQSLHQQIDAQVSRPLAGITPAVPSTNPFVALSPDERRELLQLRGQYLPLRRELQEMSNRVAAPAQPAPRRMSTEAKQSQSPERIDQAAEIEADNAYMRSEPYMIVRNFSIALGDFLKAHAGVIPDDLAKIEASSPSPLSPGISDRFELMRSGKVPEEALAYTLVAREKEPQQLSDGTWHRFYLRADGGTVTTTSGSAKKSDWKNWERHEEALMKEYAQQKKPKP